MEDLISAGLFTVYLGVTVVVILLALILYVVSSFAHMKALKMLGYVRPWMAWIPCASTYACADSVAAGSAPVRMYDKFNVPAVVYKLWWIVPLVLSSVPYLSVALNVVFMGNIYAKMYAALEGKNEQDTQVIGCISGFIPLVAIVKFLMLKTNGGY